MQKIDNFLNCLNVLETTKRSDADGWEIVRMGIIGQFNLTFELAWKALQQVLQNRAVERVGGSPGNTVRLAYKEGFIDDVDVWLEMLKRRNEAAHIYDLERVEDALDLIYSDFIPAFQKLASTLKEMVKEDSGE